MSDSIYFKLLKLGKGFSNTNSSLIHQHCIKTSCQTHSGRFSNYNKRLNVKDLINLKKKREKNALKRFDTLFLRDVTDSIVLCRKLTSGAQLSRFYVRLITCGDNCRFVLTQFQFDKFSNY